MQHNRLKLSAVLLLGLGLTGLQAQISINATGGDATGSGGTVAYSVGQVVYTTNNSTSGSVGQGIQQSYEIFTLGVIETAINISLSVFPNPTADNLIIQIGDYNNEKLSYQLFDMQGKLLYKGQATTKQTHIDTSSLPSSTYFINVFNQENKQVQSFKIIKN